MEIEDLGYMVVFPLMKLEKGSCLTHRSLFTVLDRAATACRDHVTVGFSSRHLSACNLGSFLSRGQQRPSANHQHDHSQLQ